MKRIREALRLHYECGLSLRKTAQALSISRPVLTSYLERCQAHAITYEKAQAMTDEELTACFTGKQPEDPRLTELRDKFIHYVKELTRVGVTRQLLWEEYRIEKPGGYSYSQFCYHFQKWQDSRELYMRIEHKAGDKLYVDYTGKKMEVVDPRTGEIRTAEIFVAALGASKLIYAEAVWTQQKHDFIRAQINALTYIGGVPRAIVPDCLKTAVTKAHRYEPDINPEYQDFANHYETTILAARPYKPKDKAQVEVSVRIVYQRICAPLRNRVFHSLEELNRAIREQLEVLNNRPLKDYGVSRWELFNEIEKDTLMPLPVEEYTIRHFARCKVQFNYHLYLTEDKHYYSVPYQHRGKHVEVRYTSSMVEIYLNNSRIALHKRVFKKFSYSTNKDHMPPGHAFMNDWSAEKFIGWAHNIGEQATEVIEGILSSKGHPEQGYKVCLGILNLAREYGKDRLNKACKRALYLDSLSLKVITNILKNGLEDMDDECASERQLEMFHHENIRGPEYYH
ncbi:IS21 family transposase [Candidatus Dependentiae bacterium]|nr:IS21 family transposase [Candidatus Dependentiae bacterium]